MDYTISILDIPEEILLTIFDHIDDNVSNVTFFFTCKTFNNLLIKHNKTDEFISKSDIFSIAMQYNSIKLLKWFIHNNCPITNEDDFYLGCCDLNTIQWLVKKGYEINRSSLNAIASTGKIDILSWLYDKEPKISKYVHIDMCVSAAREGHIHIIEWLNEKKDFMDSKTINDIAIASIRNGHKHIVRACIDNGMKYTQKILIEAAKSNNFKMLKWLYRTSIRYCKSLSEDKRREKIRNDNVVPKYTGISFIPNKGFINVSKTLPSNLCDYAVSNDNIPMLKWLLKHGCTYTKSTYKHIKSIEMLKFYHTNGGRITNDFVSHISTKYDTTLDMIIYIIEQGFEYNIDDIFANLLDLYKINIVRWLLDNNYRCNSKVFYNHLKHGEYIDIDMLKYIIDNGIVEKETIIPLVARTYSIRNLDLLKYLLDNGLQWDRNIYTILIEHEALDCIKWLLDNKYPYYGDLCLIAMEHHNNLDMVKFLYENSVPIDIDLCLYAVIENNLPMLQWARSIGCPWYSNIGSIAVRIGNVKMVEWMVDNGYPYSRDIVRYLTKKNLIPRTEEYYNSDSLSED